MTEPFHFARINRPRPARFNGYPTADQLLKLIEPMKDRLGWHPRLSDIPGISLDDIPQKLHEPITPANARQLTLSLACFRLGINEDCPMADEIAFWFDVDIEDYYFGSPESLVPVDYVSWFVPSWMVDYIANEDDPEEGFSHYDVGNLHGFRQDLAAWRNGKIYPPFSHGATLALLVEPRDRECFRTHPDYGLAGDSLEVLLVSLVPWWHAVEKNRELISLPIWT